MDHRRLSGALRFAVTYCCAAFAMHQPAISGELVWQDDLQTACRAARDDKRNVLVRVGAEWCGWCEKLAEELEQPEVRQALQKFTLVYLDADKQSGPVRRLGVGPIPALRVLNADGKVLATHDGYLPAAELADWLREAAEGGAEQLPEILTSTGPLDDKAVRGLLHELGRREAQRREAAIRRLEPHVDAASDVVGMLRNKKLAVRLSALELLRTWRAPIDDLDPWRAETIDQARLDALAAWAAKASAPPEDGPLEADELAAARRDIDAFLNADDVEAEAIAARLARYGRRLLEEVYARLKKPGDDRQRERLTWLRYRLVATDALALEWPSGLARLAANGPAVRHQAAQELIARATADDEPLLLEMFSDLDPLVRELSLKALHSTGGERVSKTLVRLLDDPEPNVRAAVLKQLAEAPSPAIVPTVGKYIAGESDADLVVHAVRLLRATGGKAAIDVLMKLLGHASWRVRAEAAEALGECVSSHERQVSESLKADTYVALIDALDDEDGFVVSRAMLGLRHADVPAMIDPLAAAAEKRPELAKAAAEAMTGGQHTRAKALERLWDWTRHENDDLRAAGLIGLCEASADDLGEAFEKALADPSQKVRLTAAQHILKKFEEQRPYSEEMIGGLTTTHLGQQVDELTLGEGDDVDLAGALWQGVKRLLSVPAARPPETTPSEEMPAEPVRSKAAPAKGGRNRPDPWEPWLAELRSDEGRPDWAKTLVAPLQKMLTADAPDDRLAAALALAPLAHEADSLPVLRELLAADAKVLGEAARALPWLPWPQRLAFFHELRERAETPESLAELGHYFSLLRDLRADGPLWQMLAVERVTPAVAQELLEDLQRVYRIGQPHYGNGSPPPPQLDEEKAKEYALGGNAWQRLAAMSLILATDGPLAAEIARQIYDDVRHEEDARLDALQFLLLAEKPNAARTTALDVLRSGSPGDRRVALAYLARGPEPLRIFHNGTFHVASSESGPFSPGGDEETVAPQVPEGLEADDLRPFLDDTDRALAAFAGYLLTQLGEADGLPPLMKQWRAEGAASQLWTPLVYHAIAALDDPRQAGALLEIYEGIEHNAVNVRDFYWTIRTMTGPDVLALRKRIREEVGMDQLR